MDLIDRLRELALQIPKQIEFIKTEEATKTALVLPFIQALGYNIFDPSEVNPEFVADVGIKKGEKVDYVIHKDRKPILMFECKTVNTDLDKIHPTQLYRYFSVSEVRFGILTNGIVYRFYSDLEEPNKLDVKPFFEFNMLDFSDLDVEELKRFSKSSFDMDGLLNTASELKYTREIKRILAADLKEPSADFIRYFAGQVYSGKLMQSVIEQFSGFTRRAFASFINDQINDRLRVASALSNPEPMEAAESEPVPEIANGKQIETTQDEIEGFHIVKALLREVMASKRIALRDAQSYCNILLDNNKYKPLMRMYFNTPNKSIGLFDASKKPPAEEKIKIESLEDIYKHAERLKATAVSYDKSVT